MESGNWFIDLRDSPATAKRRLGEITTRLENLRGEHTFHQRLNNYHQWVASTETVMRSLVTDPSAWEGLFTARYWRLDGGGGDNPTAVWLHSEMDYQLERLRELQGRLRAGATRWQNGDSKVVVLDTNVLMHARQADEIDWAKLTGASAVRVVVPLAVLDELDRSSNRGSETHKRARTAMRQLRRLRGSTRSPDHPTPLRGKDTLEFLVEPTGHRRLQQVDDEILRQVSAIRQFAPTSAIATFDVGMQVRAEALGIEVVLVPEAYRKGAGPIDD